MYFCFTWLLCNYSAFKLLFGSIGIRGKDVQTSEIKEDNKQELQINYSFQQDYLKRFYSSDSKIKNANSLEVRLKRMEGFFHLPITGILSPRIIEIMEKPRCGVPDVAEFSLFPNHPKWTSKVVTYRSVLLWLILAKAI